MDIEQIRKDIVCKHAEARLSHVASALSCVDILVALYEVMKPTDKFILSKGHAVHAWHIVARHAGRPTNEEPDFSLGNGLSVACGMALAGQRVYVLMSDGECNEGSVWEAAMFAAHHKLKNLTAIIDDNGFQAMGRTKDILDLSPMDEKWKAFGWNALNVDGHAVASLVRHLQAPSEKPTIVIAKTIKGKGVDYMEDKNDWHYRIPEL